MAQHFYSAPKTSPSVAFPFQILSLLLLSTPNGLCILNGASVLICTTRCGLNASKQTSKQSRKKGWKKRYSSFFVCLISLGVTKHCPNKWVNSPSWTSPVVWCYLLGFICCLHLDPFLFSLHMMNYVDVETFTKFLIFCIALVLLFKLLNTVSEYLIKVLLCLCIHLYFSAASNLWILYHTIACPHKLFSTLILVIYQNLNVSPCWR